VQQAGSGEGGGEGSGVAGFGLVPLAGGHSGETFLGEAAGERTVVRVYAGRGAGRGPEAPVVDAAVLRLVRGLLPVPAVLDVHRPRPAEGVPGLLVTSFLPGVRLDDLLTGLSEDARRRLGQSLGVILGRLACMPLLRRGGFVDGDLAVRPWPQADLPAMVDGLRGGSAITDWPATTYDGLVRVSEQAQDVLDAVTRTCLVHGDLNPKNLLVDPATTEVTGVLDWEFAHAGVPGADLGNLLRFDRDPVLGAAVLESYRGSVPDAGPGVLETARAADLVALVDLAARRAENPVTERAHHLLVAIARTRDLHASPDAADRP
jgi:aminoglycoside phosphotransferase (APT) family kinase protein